MALDFETEWQKLMSPSYSVPKAGTWDPVSESWQGGIDPNSNNIWSDPRTDPGAMYQFLANNSMVGGNPEDTYNLLVGRGINPDFASQVREAHRSGLDNKGGGFFDFGGLTDFVKKDIAPFALMAAATYGGASMMGPAAGSGAAAGGASAGGTAAGLESLPLGSQAPSWWQPTADFATREGALAQAAATNPMANPAVMGSLTAGAGGGALGGGNALQQAPGAAPGGSAITEPYGGFDPVAVTRASEAGTLLPTAANLPFGLTWGDLARGIPGVLGAVASSQQADAYQDASNQMLSYGAPSRQRFEASFAPGFSMASDPGYNDALNQAAKSTLHALSVQGNPAGSPNAWSAALNDLYQRQAYNALQEYRRMNAGAGGLAGLTTAAPSFANNAITAQGNVYGALGGAASDIFNPPKSLEQLIKEIRRAGV